MNAPDRKLPRSSKASISDTGVEAFAGLIDATHRSHPVAAFGIDSCVLDANDNFLALVGHSREELIGQPHASLCPPDDAAPQAHQTLWARLAMGESVTHRMRLLTHDGAAIDVDGSYHPVADDAGNPVRVLAILAERTADAQTQAAARQHAAGFRSASVALMTVDRTLAVTAINDAAETLLDTLSDTIRRHRPDMRLDRIVGTRADAIFALPDTLIRRLSDSANLPLRSDLAMGEVRFSLKVDGILDDAGGLTGYTFEWTDITASRVASGVLAALDRVQATIAFDLDGTIRDANDNFLQVMGYTRDDLIGKHHRILCDTDFAASPDYKDLWRRLGAGEFVAGEFRRIAKDGTDVWINASYNPVVDADGKPFRVIKFATDVTAQVRLRKDAETLSLVANETDNSVIICNRMGRIDYVNPGFTKLTGYTLAEVAGKTPGSVLQGPLTDPAAVRTIREKLATRQPFQVEILNYGKSGRPHWINLAINPILDAGGEVARYVSIQTDITETKEQQLEFTARLDAISRASAVIEFTRDGTVITANDNFCAATGYAPEEIKGKHHRMFCDAAFADSAEYDTFWRNLRDGQFQSGKFKRLRKSGGELWLRASYSPIFDAEKKVSKVVKFATDITIEVEMEKEVSRIAAQFADRAKDISEQAEKVAGGAQTLGCTTEEISASIEELSASIDSIAQNGRTSDQIAQRTKIEADVGAKAIERSIESMDRINASSEEINEIVKVISEIAGQTNMLAFNAAIEAARAGEHGLGFSVVADEVRKLAERSSLATKEISKLIAETVKRVSQGSEVSREAGAAFKKILDGISETTDSISQIAVAASEQQTAARDVAEAIQSIVEASEQAVVASDAIAHSTGDLMKGAQSLRTEIAKFGN